MGKITLLEGHVLDRLATVQDNSAHCIITSPPYWGLRDYGLPPSVWGGDAECEHEWGDIIPGMSKGGSGTPTDKNNRGEGYGRGTARGAYCQLCGAWRGCLGLEPTPGLYVDHMVEVFREVRRVLREDGVVWLNLGDSYASGKGTCYNPGGGKNSLGKTRKEAGVHPLDRGNKSTLEASGLKPKDLVGIPWRVALALQADGWWLRNDIIWAKGVSGQRLLRSQVYEAALRVTMNVDIAAEIVDELDLYEGNCMPESVRDRCTRAHEHVFLLAKSKRYFYDRHAILDESVTKDIRKPYGSNGACSMDGRDKIAGKPQSRDAATRNRRDVWTIVVKGFKGSHYATYNTDLIEPMILAGTSERGCCPECGAPWKRIVRTKASFEGGSRAAGRTAEEVNAKGKWKEGDQYGKNIKLGPVISVRTIGWRPTCEHYPRMDEWREYLTGKLSPEEEIINQSIGKVRAELLALWEGANVVPCTVLDPFIGSGTTAIAAIDLGRDCIGIDLDLSIARERLKNA